MIDFRIQKTIRKYDDDRWILKKFSRFFLESYKELLFDSITGYNPIETQQKIHGIL